MLRPSKKPKLMAGLDAKVDGGVKLSNEGNVQGLPINEHDAKGFERNKKHRRRYGHSSTPPTTMPAFDALPNELLVEIFSQLDFTTLTKCTGVNKLFKAITEHSTFDKVFFRTKAIKPEEFINLDKLQVNPVFRRIYYTCRSKLDDARLLLTEPDGTFNCRELALTDSSAAKQNATEPAVTSLWLSPYGDDGDDDDGTVHIKSDHAVTVQDVMQGLCDYYKRGAPYDACHYFFEGFFKGKQSSHKRVVLWACWGS